MNKFKADVAQIIYEVIMRLSMMFVTYKLIEISFTTKNETTAIVFFVVSYFYAFLTVVSVYGTIVNIIKVFIKGESLY